MQAIADINLIRQTSGCLATTTVMLLSSDSAFVRENLKQRLSSLPYEGGTVGSTCGAAAG